MKFRHYFLLGWGKLSNSGLASPRIFDLFYIEKLLISGELEDIKIYIQNKAHIHLRSGNTFIFLPIASIIHKKSTKILFSAGQTFVDFIQQ